MKQTILLAALLVVAMITTTPVLSTMTQTVMAGTRRRDFNGLNSRHPTYTHGGDGGVGGNGGTVYLRLSLSCH